jgi:menaquinone-dependent protoporphyrinogen oxidase
VASVLVAHATKFGSTREVAERVAARLRDHGLDVEESPARWVKKLEGYDAVVFGGALYMFRLTRQGRRFFARHHGRLSRMPVAVFGMGPLEDLEEHYVHARQHLDKTLARFPEISPVAVAIFGGVLNPEKLRFPYSNPGMKAMPPVDLRDWQAIEDWADSLPQELGLE